MRHARFVLLAVMVLLSALPCLGAEDSCSVEPAVSSGVCLISWQVQESSADSEAVLWKISPEPAGAIDHFGLEDGLEGNRQGDSFLYFGRYGNRPHDEMHFPLRPGVYEWRVTLDDGTVLSSNRFEVRKDGTQPTPQSVYERITALKDELTKCSDDAKPPAMLKLAAYQTAAGRSEEGKLILTNLLKDHGTSPQAVAATKILMQHEAHFKGWDSSAALMKSIATDMGQPELVTETAIRKLASIYRINSDSRGLAVFSDLYYSARLHPATRAAAGSELARGYYMAGKTKEALQVVKSLIDSPLEALPPAGVHALEEIAGYADWIEHDREIVSLLEWVKGKPDVWGQISAETKVRLADAYAKSERYPDAERLYKSLIGHGGRQRSAYCSYALARLQQFQNMRNAARQSFASVLEDYPEVRKWTCMSRLCLALMDMEDGRVDVAQDSIAQLAAEKPDMVELSLGYRQLAEYYQEGGDANKSREYYLKVARNSAFEAPDRINAWEKIGRGFEEQQQYSQAEQAYKNAVQLFKESKLRGLCPAELMLQRMSLQLAGGSSANSTKQ